MKNMGGRKTSLVYLERNGCYLILHRTKKDHDENHDKWIGLGGKFEDGESPEECVCREVLEETGVHVRNVRCLTNQPWPFTETFIIDAT